MLKNLKTEKNDINTRTMFKQCTLYFWVHLVVRQCIFPFYVYGRIYRTYYLLLMKPQSDESYDLRARRDRLRTNIWIWFAL